MASKVEQVKGAVSDKAVLEKTGKSLDHWFAVLDAFDAKSKGHAAAARHLEDQGLGSWYAQGITVAYERARGLRATHQGSDGKFQVSVSRVVPTSVARVARALEDPGERKAWLQAAPRPLALAFEEGIRGGATVKVRDASLATLRFRWGAATVEIRVSGTSTEKCSVSVQLRGLAGLEEVEERRADWKAALESLRSHLSG
jgi:hypothetical protein